jgi:hypothetical protein
VRFRTCLVFVPTVVAVACSGGAGDAAGRPGSADPQLVFWGALQGLCGQAFTGAIVESAPGEVGPDPTRPVIDVDVCDVGETRFSLDLGPARSGRWVVRTTAAGMHLSETRGSDRSSDGPDPFSGDTRGRGTATVQDFQAEEGGSPDGPDVREVRTLEIRPAEMLAFAVESGGERVLRIEFDLSRPVERPPPAPAP